MCIQKSESTILLTRIQSDGDVQTRMLAFSFTYSGLQVIMLPHYSLFPFSPLLVFPFCLGLYFCTALHSPMPLWCHTVKLDCTDQFLSPFFHCVYDFSVSCHRAVHPTPISRGLYSSIVSIISRFCVFNSWETLLSTVSISVSLIIRTFHTILRSMSSNMRAFPILMIVSQLEFMAFSLLPQQRGMIRSNVNGHENLYKQPNNENCRGK